MIASAVAIVFASRAVIRGGTQSLAARTRSCSSVRPPDMGVSEQAGSGCAVRSRRLARVRASGLVTSLRDEAVAGVVIVRPSTQQPYGYSPCVKRYGGATRRRWRRFPGQRRPSWHSAAMRAVATKSLVIWPRACWPEGCSFGHWRSGTSFSLGTGGATRRAVRKHRAPKGALRRPDEREPRPSPYRHVRKHRAPKGALRRDDGTPAPPACSPVRKHRAPKGALRQVTGRAGRGDRFESQKAPSAKRCIKTLVERWVTDQRWHVVRKHRAPKGALRRSDQGGDDDDRRVRKHRAPKGALRLLANDLDAMIAVSRSESTERPKNWLFIIGGVVGV